MEPDASVMVKTESVSKIYRLSKHNKIEALKNITLCISRGQSVLIGGPSGSGKSTLLNLLGFLSLPSSGRILHGSEDVTRYSEEELCRIRRHKIGFIFQEFHLLPRMTAWENVSISLVPLGVREKERFLRACVLLERLGLQERLFHRPEELSGGEQQRVAAARALINNPEFILTDEPTSNIDAVSAQKVLEILADLKNKGCTIVVSTHDLDSFRRGPFGADAAYYLTNGTIEPLSADLRSVCGRDTCA
jgi:putative ABC transport system ATP-binding protein